MAIKKASDLDTPSGARFFRPADYETAQALLIEPHTLRESVPSTDFAGNPVEIDVVDAQITAFLTAEQVEKGEPEEVFEATLDKGAFVRVARKAIGDAFVAVPEKIRTKKGFQMWVFQDVDVKTETFVAEYYDKTADEEAPF